MIVLSLIISMGCAPEPESGTYSIDGYNAQADTDNNGADSDDSTTSDSGDQDVFDTGSLTSFSPRNISAIASDDIVSVVTVRWTTDAETTGIVEFGTSDDYEFVTPPTALGTSHERLLLGIPPDHEIHYRVVTSDESGEEHSADRTTSTGALPSSIPVFTTAGFSKPGFRILPTMGAYRGVVVVNEQGEIVWYYNAQADTVIRAYFTHDGQHIVFNRPLVEEGLGVLKWVSLDGATESTMAVPYISHDFTQLPDGTLSVIANEVREVDGYTEMVSGDQIIEIATDGTQTVVWSSWDQYTPGAHGAVVDGDWTHSNAIDYDPVEDVYYLAVLKLGSIIKIDRSTGELLWTLGGEWSDFTTDSELTNLGYRHHQFYITDNIITIFVNGVASDAEGSQVVQFELDESNMTATETYRYSSYQEPYVYALGAVSLLDEDTMDITWSTSGYIEQVENDSLAWQLEAEIGHIFGYSTFVETMYAELNQAE